MHVQTQQAPYDDVRVRKALLYAFAPENFIAKTVPGVTQRKDTLFPQGSKWATPDQPKQQVNDLSKAQSLIDDYIADKNNGQPLTLTMATNPSAALTTQVIQQQWALDR